MIGRPVVVIGRWWLAGGGWQGVVGRWWLAGGDRPAVNRPVKGAKPVGLGMCGGRPGNNGREFRGNGGLLFGYYDGATWFGAYQEEAPTRRYLLIGDSERK